VHRGILHDAVLVAQLRADVRANLTLFVVGDRQVLLRFLTLLKSLADLTELRRGRGGEREVEDDGNRNNRLHHALLRTS
jgi:hypothetical protein